MSIIRAEGIEQVCVSVEQQALLGGQSTTAKVDNDVREERSVGEMPRWKRTKDNWTKENRRLLESYLRSKPKEKGL